MPSSSFVGWLSLTHAKRFNGGTAPAGRSIRERYQAVSRADRADLYRVIRYVERNPCAAA